MLSGFKEDFQMDVFKILAAILHLGNVQVTTMGNERSSVSVRTMFTLLFLGAKVSGTAHGSLAFMDEHQPWLDLPGRLV